MEPLNERSANCICTRNLYSVHCPDSFYQGGRILHVIGTGSTKEALKYVEVNQENSEHPPVSQKAITHPDTGTMRMRQRVPSEGSVSSDDQYDMIAGSVPKPLAPVRRQTIGSGNVEMMNADSLMTDNRANLRKFEALSIGGQSLTEISIGGFKVDMSKAAQKASIVAPLPPAKLPIIYVDHTMNFLHHFFQGLERLIGRDVLLNIVSKSKFFTGETLILLPLIEDIMRRGYERKDNNLTIFVKSVMSSTFELDERTEATDENRGLLVAANLWGFRYIECGIEMKEADLQMWLKSNYDSFHTLHFDTFKDSGVPAFVTEGVQTRYEQPLVQMERETKGEARVFERAGHTIKVSEDNFDSDYEERRYDREYRRKRSSKGRGYGRREQTMGSIIFGNRK